MIGMLVSHIQREHVIVTLIALNPLIMYFLSVGRVINIAMLRNMIKE